MKVLDLFSGIGGFSLGLEAAGMETVAFCEREPFCQAVLKKHWPDIPCHEDVTTLDGKQYNGTIDVIAGGFPCQDISLAGKGAGLAGERSGLWFEYLRIIKEVQPRYVIIENVSALRSRGLEEVLRSLAEIGYDAEWHCIPASAIGAPHRRDRIWIVAYTRSAGRDAGNVCQQRDDGKPIEQGRSIISAEPSEAPSPVANAESIGHSRGKPSNKASEKRTIEGGGQSEGLWITEPCDADRIQHDGIIPDAMCEGLEGQRTLASRIGTQLKDPSYSRGWQSEPNVGRVADGIPARVHRLKALGNSIVPQIAEIIGEAIMQAEGEVA